MTTATTTASLERLSDRFDPGVFDGPGDTVRIRLEVLDGDTRDALVAPDGEVRLVEPEGEPDALLAAGAATWERIADDVRGGMAAHRAGRLRVRRNLHLGVGFLAATSGADGPGRLRFHSVETRAGRVSLVEAGSGPPLVALHGLGGTKASFLPTLAALADHHRVIAMDFPGFGESAKPIAAPYDAPWFARGVLDVADELGLDRRTSSATAWAAASPSSSGSTSPTGSAGSCSCARRSRGARTVAGCASYGSRGPSSASSSSRRGRSSKGSCGACCPARATAGRLPAWTSSCARISSRAGARPSTRLRATSTSTSPTARTASGRASATLEPAALFVWGKHDTLVPEGFKRHVVEAAPHAEHLTLDCGHVPQVEAPRDTHHAMARFVA